MSFEIKPFLIVEYIKAYLRIMLIFNKYLDFIINRWFVREGIERGPNRVVWLYYSLDDVFTLSVGECIHRDPCRGTCLFRVGGRGCSKRVACDPICEEGRRVIRSCMCPCPSTFIVGVGEL